MNPRKHYYEAEVGRAVRKAVKSGMVTRDNLFLQTKSTLRHGQDRCLPYDPESPIRDQVAGSFERSL